MFQAEGKKLLKDILVFHYKNFSYDNLCNGSNCNKIINMDRTHKVSKCLICQSTINFHTNCLDVLLCVKCNKYNDKYSKNSIMYLIKDELADLLDVDRYLFYDKIKILSNFFKLVKDCCKIKELSPIIDEKIVSYIGLSPNKEISIYEYFRSNKNKKKLDKYVEKFF